MAFASPALYARVNVSPMDRMAFSSSGRFVHGPPAGVVAAASPPLFGAVEVAARFSPTTWAPALATIPSHPQVNISSRSVIFVLMVVSPLLDRNRHRKNYVQSPCQGPCPLSIIRVPSLILRHRGPVGTKRPPIAT